MSPLVTKCMSSYKVFLEHVKFQESDEEPDVSQVFSIDCFDTWLKTRTNKIKHPEQSFQRALYAHIRGADGRKPFPEPIEAALLKKLRGDVLSKHENPWTSMFGDNHLRLGKKGFKKKGFHERRRSMVSSTEKRPHTAQQPKSEPLPQDTQPYFVPHFTAQNTPYAPQGPFPNFYPTFPNHPYDAGNAFQEQPMKHQRGLNGERRPLQVNNPTAPASAWDVLVNVVRTYIPPTWHSNNMCNTGKPKINYLFHPDVVNSLSTADPSSTVDFRFRWDFIKPAPNEQRFDPSKPIAKLVFSTNWHCVEEDDIALEMFGSSSLGGHVFDKCANLESVMFANIRNIPELVLTGRTWTRMFLNKKGDVKGVFLLDIALSRLPEQFVCYLQDQSEQFKHVLESPQIKKSPSE